jgi:hypothetical protein
LPGVDFRLPITGPEDSTASDHTPHGQDMLRDFVARYKQTHPEADCSFSRWESREVLERLRLVILFPPANSLSLRVFM